MTVTRSSRRKIDSAMASNAKVMSPMSVIFLVPNIIGYIRAFITIILVVKFEEPTYFITGYSLVLILDTLDGIAARYLNQVSAFGAWLDVLLDILMRTMVWCRLFPKIGFIFPCIEWLCFVCTHSLGANWKSHSSDQPHLLKAVMQNSFKSVPGAYAMAGLWLLPLWLYLLRTLMALNQNVVVFNEPVLSCITTFLIGGRALSMYCELWFILDHIKALIYESVECEEDKVD